MEFIDNVAKSIIILYTYRIKTYTTYIHAAATFAGHRTDPENYWIS